MSIQERFLKVFKEYKGNIAIHVGGIPYSYEYLFSDASGGVNALLSVGFEGNSPVLLMGMRGYFTYAGLVATVLAGGFYVPTNPDFPAERNLKIISQSESKYAFLDTGYQKEYDEVLKKCEGLTIIVYGQSEAENMGALYSNHKFYALSDFQREIPSLISPKESDFIYLLFTSGSTGEPKGVAITNGNVEHYISAFSRRSQVLPEDRFIQLFDLTFDVSAHNIFLAFCNGASIYIPNEGSSINPVKFAKDHGITHWSSVPASVSISRKLRVLKANILPKIKYTMLCGEALPYDLVADWNSVAPNSFIENNYGPTEATITCTHHKFDRDFSFKYAINGLVPIGFPFHGMKMLVVDEDLNPVKKGDVGEFLLAGPQLAVGYYNDPEKTKEKFINIYGDTYYRTGDLVRENEAGYVFIGRLDTQIKIRGYRIELSEVEHAACKVAGATTAVALALGDAIEGYNGIALFLQDDGLLVIQKIIEGLRNILPLYMVPSKIVFVADFPRNANGKIDKNKLKELI